MTPKEKAELLYNSFDMIIYTDQDHKAQVVKCCLIHIEMLLMDSDNIFQSMYYEQVKQEIEKL